MWMGGRRVRPHKSAKVHKVNKDLRVVDGKVVANATSQEEIYKRLMDFRDKDIAIEYTGEFPDNIAIVF